MYLRLHRDKRSEAKRSSAWLADRRAGGPIPRRDSASLVQICVRGRTGNNSTKGETDGQREKESFLVAPTAIVRVVVVCFCGGSDRGSHGRQKAF